MLRIASMAFLDFIPDRVRFRPLAMRWAALFACAILACSVSDRAEASIVGPEAPEFCLEPPSNGLGSGSAIESEIPAESTTSDAVARLIELGILSAQLGHSSNSQSTSGSHSVTGSGGAVALAYLPLAFISDPATAGWVSGERQVALPTPPINELLKPPQVA